MDDIEDEYINKPSIKEEDKKEDKNDENENSEAPPSIMQSISENQSKFSNSINDSNMNLHTSELNNIQNDDNEKDKIKLRSIKNKQGNENIEDKKDEKLLELKDVIVDINKTPEIYNVDNFEQKKEDETKYPNKSHDNINKNNNINNFNNHPVQQPYNNNNVQVDISGENNHNPLNIKQENYNEPNKFPQENNIQYNRTKTQIEEYHQNEFQLNNESYESWPYGHHIPHGPHFPHGLHFPHGFNSMHGPHFPHGPYNENTPGDYHEPHAPHSPHGAHFPHGPPYGHHFPHGPHGHHFPHGPYHEPHGPDSPHGPHSPHGPQDQIFPNEYSEPFEPSNRFQDSPHDSYGSYWKYPHWHHGPPGHHFPHGPFTHGPHW